MIGADQVNASHISASSLTTSDISFSGGSLNDFGISTLGSISGGSLSVGSGGVTIGSSGAGFYIANNRLSAYSGQDVTVLIDGSSGTITATKFQYTSDYGGISYLRYKNSGGTTIVEIDASNGLSINNTSVTPNIQERLSLSYNGTEQGYIYAYNNSLNMWAVSKNINIGTSTSGLITITSVGNLTLYSTSGNIVCSSTISAGAISASSLSTTGAISCGTGLDMTTSAITNVTTITGTNAAVYALHLTRNSEYKPDTTVHFNDGDANYHSVVFKDGLITSWTYV